MKELIQIQSELKAPKNQRNNFGKYNYRSCEDILEAVKPLLKKHNCILVIDDEIKEVGGITFVEATATIKNEDTIVAVKAQAGIDINRKGMDIAQSFGSSSSYARKYALNGLFLIDDTKDADATNTHGKEPIKEVKEQLTPTHKRWDGAVKALAEGKTKLEGISSHFNITKENIDLLLDESLMIRSELEKQS